MAEIQDHIRKKQKQIDRLDDLLSRLVLTSQESLRRLILADILPLLNVVDGNVKNTYSNLSAAQKVLDIFTQWVEKDGQKLADAIAGAVIDAHQVSRVYYGASMIGAKTQKQVDKAMNRSLKSTIRRYGIEVGKKKVAAKAGGYIISTIADQAISQSIETVIRNSVISEGPLSKLRQDIGIELGRGSGAGVLERTLADQLPQPALKADREISIEVSQSLQLNFAFYQGGEISTTRPFCSERNNKVFSREEITKFGTAQDKYGGYTNKSAGKFQGKTKVYNPLLDLGGYNCRHSYDWISDDLAKVFRPELFKDEK